MARILTQAGTQRVIPTRTETSDYTLTFNDYLVRMNSVALAQIDFPQLNTSSASHTYVIHNINTGPVELIPFPGDTINGSAGSYIVGQYESVVLIAPETGTDWAMIQPTRGGKGHSNLDFGNGQTDAQTIITGQLNITATSVVNAWIRVFDTESHTADEHWLMLSSLHVAAGNIIPGTGFTIYGIFDSPHVARQTNAELLLLNQTKARSDTQQGVNTSAIVQNRGLVTDGIWAVSWEWR